MAITSVGINSGVLTSDLIDKLVAAEKEPTELRLDRKQEGLEAKLSAYGQIQSAISDLRLDARVLSKASSFTRLTLNSSHSAISGSADTNAKPGSYTIEVSHLARAHSLASDNFSATTDSVGTGTLTIASGSSSAAITIDASNNSLQGVADAINAESELKVNASIIYTGSAYRLALSSVDTGLDNVITVNVSADGDGDDTDNAGLSRLSFNGTENHMSEPVTALDASFSINGVDVVRSSNTVTDVIKGVTLDLNSSNVGSPANVTIAQDVDTMVENVEKFFEKFNALQSLYNELTQFNPDTQEAAVLLGDATLRNVFNQIRSSVHQMVAGLQGEGISSLADVGIVTNKDTGEISLNRSDFAAALAKYPADMEALFSVQGRTTDSQVDFISHQVGTKAGSYAIDITQMATQGALVGAAVLPAPPATISINADNDTFEISVDGQASGTITLTQSASYTAETLASEIESQINASTSLRNAGVSVSVAYADNAFSISSNTYGSASSVEITAVDTNTTADLGLSLAMGTAGLDVAGTIGGKAATGKGQVLAASEEGDAKGIKVLVKGGVIGDRGEVSLIRGIGDAIVERVNQFLSVKGALVTRQAGLQESLDGIGEERISLSDRLAMLESRLALQFTSADILIGKLTSTGDFLSNFFKSMTPSDK
jgi:flagellar hook-associated protein 2